jgi:hypothetical protein
MDMRFGSWNVRSLYGTGSLKTVTSELAKYKLEQVAVERSDGMRVVLIWQMIIHFLWKWKY